MMWLLVARLPCCLAELLGPGRPGVLDDAAALVVLANVLDDAAALGVLANVLDDAAALGVLADALDGV